MEATQPDIQAINFDQLTLENVPEPEQHHCCYRFWVEIVWYGLVDLARCLWDIFCPCVPCGHRPVHEVPDVQPHYPKAAQGARPKVRVAIPIPLQNTKYTSQIQFRGRIPKDYVQLSQKQRMLLATTRATAQHNPAIALARNVLEGNNESTAAALDTMLSHVKSHDRRADRLMRVLHEWMPHQKLSRDARVEAQVMLQGLEHATPENLEMMTLPSTSNASSDAITSIPREELLHFVEHTKDFEDLGCMLARCIIKGEKEQASSLIEILMQSHGNIQSDMWEMMQAFKEDNLEYANILAGHYLKRAMELDALATGKTKSQIPLNTDDHEVGASGGSRLSSLFNFSNTFSRLQRSFVRTFVESEDQSGQKVYDKNKGAPCCVCFNEETILTMPCCSTNDNLVNVCSECVNHHVRDKTRGINYNDWLQHGFKIPCVSYECNEYWSPYPFLPIFEKETKTALEKIAGQYESEHSNSRYVTCPKCSYFALIDKNQETYQCDSSNCEFNGLFLCTECGAQWNDRHSCPSTEVKKLRDTIQKLTICLQIGLTKYKMCPLCDTHVELRDGCRLVYCGVCHKDFCWNCTKRWQDCADQPPYMHGNEAFSLDCPSETQRNAIRRITRNYKERISDLRTAFQEKGGDMTTLPSIP